MDVPSVVAVCFVGIGAAFFMPVSHCSGRVFGEDVVACLDRLVTDKA
jgi:hypothetical protein